MNSFSKDRLLEFKNSFKNFKVAVIGDMMLDGYLWGDVKRISPEAPVPIVEIDNEFFRFGGAANVALNLSTLGSNVIPIGVIGNDRNGEIFTKLLQNAKINSDFFVTDTTRTTTTKTRVISSNQQIVRIDNESKTSISSKIENELFARLKGEIKNIDAIILEDYNKGVFTFSLIKKIIELANEYNVIITVDPKFDNFFAYNNVTLFKPNLKETENAFGVKLSSKTEIENIGFKLLERIKSKYLLLTLGADGMVVFENGENIKFIETKARKVLDVSGAGDTVIATLTLALLANASIFEATYLANYAGGLVCEEAGVVPIKTDNLFKHLISEIL